MLILSLEATDEDARPAFKNVSTCKKWLQQLQFTNLTTTQAILREQLAEFDRYPFTPADEASMNKLLGVT